MERPVRVKEQLNKSRDRIRLSMRLRGVFQFAERLIVIICAITCDSNRATNASQAYYGDHLCRFSRGLYSYKSLARLSERVYGQL